MREKDNGDKKGEMRRYKSCKDKVREGESRSYKIE
jgi:hypothetical protein